MGYDLKDLADRKKMVVDYVHIERSEIEETGEYDLEGLFVRLGYAIDSIGAKRVVLDTIESIFAGLPNPSILRAELRRLFRWLKDKGVTAIVTGERGDGTLTRQGLEEYVSDCVILLDHRTREQISTRRLQIIKYRGSTHGTNEYPFLIDEQGISVLPITSLGLEHKASSERVSSGVPRLDTMLGGKGYFRGTSVLVSGTAGTGKSSLAAHFVDAACRRGERCVYFATEESPDLIVRNMRSIGIDLGPWVKKGLLRFDATRPTFHGLEMHLLRMHKLVGETHARVVVVDPITSYISLGDTLEVKSMLTRLIDFFKANQITAFFTSLTEGGSALEQSEVGISSLMDTWILLRHIEINGERNRGIWVLKSRGMAHSNQIREFVSPTMALSWLMFTSARKGCLPARRERLKRPKKQRPPGYASRILNGNNATSSAGTRHWKPKLQLCGQSLKQKKKSSRRRSSNKNSVRGCSNEIEPLWRRAVRQTPPPVTV